MEVLLKDFDEEGDDIADDPNWDDGEDGF